MKKLLLFSLLFAVGASAKPAHKMNSAAPVAWRTDFDSALKEARRSGKPVFVDFYTDWCATRNSCAPLATG